MANEITASSRSIRSGAVWTFSATHLMNDLMTTGMVPALLPVFKSAFHLSYAEASLVVLFSYLTSSVLQPFFGALTDKHPWPWMLPMGIFLSCAGLAAAGLAPTYVWLTVAICISGLGSGAFHPEASRGTHLASSGKAKGLAQSIFQVGGNSGQALGPLVVSLFILPLGRRGLTWFFILALLGLFLTLRILPWYKKGTLQERSNRKSIVGENHVIGMVMMVWVIILRSWCQIGVAGFLPFYFDKFHVPVRISELYEFVFLAAGALGTFLGGPLSDRFGKKTLLVASMVLAIPFAFLVPHVRGFWAVLVLFGFGLSVLSSFAVTVVYAQRLLPRSVGLASGLTIGFGVGAGGIGAFFLGTLADTLGVSKVFYLLGFLPLIAAILSILLPSDRKLEAQAAAMAIHGENENTN
ncbi:MFS transporter [Alicyclobacillus sp. TC]|uniref:MFS transporter n=1 Tax=Alicyclobacillus sp. TC TaxID=2606450 RepID=UPI001931D722|nr:MFS transporter [Alicyclobacillus sp. TC]QRF22587.1 MFS transporter [Alicyclobacillus sp. TC]